MPGILCLGEALVDRLGPPGAILPLIGRSTIAWVVLRRMWPVGWRGWERRWPFLDVWAGMASATVLPVFFGSVGVDAAAVQWDADRPSRIVLVRRGADGERQFQGFAGDRGLGFADQALEPVSLSAGARWLLIGSLSLASAPSAESLRGAVAQARSQGTALALDVNWRPTFWDGRADPAEGPGHNARALIGPLLEQAALIKLAREEALWFFASEDPAVIHAALPQRPDVVVTDGAEPVRWCLRAKRAFSQHSNLLRWSTPRVRAMPLPPVCCTGGRRPLPSGSVSRQPVVPWFALGPAPSTLSRRRFRWCDFWGG